MTKRTLTCGIAIAVLSASGALAATPGSGTYKGATSQKDAKTKKAGAVEVKVGSEGKRLKRFRMAFFTRCTDGTSYNSGFFHVPSGDDAVVRKGGKFSFETNYKAPDVNADEKADVFVTVAGRFTSSRKVKGTASVQTNIFKGGATTGALKCVSGKVRFSAKR